MRRPSLAARVLRRVMLPMVVTWLVGTAMALSIAHFFTQRAFDRSLLDDAHLLATSVRMKGGQLRLMLTPREVEAALFDQVEQLQFAITRADGSLLAGTANLPSARVDRDLSHRFDDLDHQGQRLRAVTLHREEPAPFDVVVVETTVGRGSMLQRLLLLSIAPQMLLLLLLSGWLLRAIRTDLQPLAQLQQAVDHRDASDLTPVPVQATSRDIERLACAINSLLQRLDHSVRGQREFAGNVAHELRTPLAGIRALAEYGLAQKDPQAWREQLELIVVSQARASRMVDQLLDLALAHEAKTHLKLQPVALDELVRDAVLRFLPRADAAGVDLGARGIEMTTKVIADAMLIEGVLNNLLDNALRYGVTGGNGPPTVTVALERYGGEIVLSVQDNGAGLPGELQSRLIKRGAQGETGQLLGQGAGLGLALVAQYARLMQARLTLGSGPGGHGWLCALSFALPDEAQDLSR